VHTKEKQKEPARPWATTKEILSVALCARRCRYLQSLQGKQKKHAPRKRAEETYLGTKMMVFKSWSAERGEKRRQKPPNMLSPSIGQALCAPNLGLLSRSMPTICAGIDWASSLRGCCLCWCGPNTNISNCATSSLHNLSTWSSFPRH
jgi:hypothetical protein